MGKRWNKKKELHYKEDAVRAPRGLLMRVPGT